MLRGTEYNVLAPFSPDYQFMSDQHVAADIADSDDRSVTPFELFFDLVFVYGFTQVTHVMPRSAPNITSSKTLPIARSITVRNSDRS
jgi:hypothetical protein